MPRERRRAVTQAAAGTVTTKICLKCREPFPSSGDFLCDECNRGNDKLRSPRRPDSDGRRYVKSPGKDS